MKINTLVVVANGEIPTVKVASQNYYWKYTRSSFVRKVQSELSFKSDDPKFDSDTEEVFIQAVEFARNSGWIVKETLGVEASIKASDGKEMGILLEDFLNTTYRSEGENFVEHLTHRMHRHLQYLLYNLVTDLLVSWHKMYLKGLYDGRNKIALERVSRIVEYMVGKDMLYIPYEKIENLVGK